MSFEEKNGQVTAVTLVLDRPSGSYSAGEVVTGHCIITNTGTIEFDCIEVRLVCKARVMLPANDNSSNNNYADKDTGMERFTKELVLLDYTYKPGTVYHSSLPTGKHDIGFSFVIPTNVPSSLDAPLGFIRYKVKAKAKSEKAELVLNVISSPSIPPQELMVPIVMNKDKSVGLINGKPVLLHCELPRTGFTLGTKIPVRCTVNNQSNKTIILKGALRQEITFRAHEEERKVTNKLCSMLGCQIDPRTDRTHDLIITVPINLPIVHNTCPIISVQYLVTAKLAIPAAFDLRLNIPVILTNQPLKEESS